MKEFTQTPLKNINHDSFLQSLKGGLVGQHRGQHISKLMQ